MAKKSRCDVINYVGTYIELLDIIQVSQLNFKLSNEQVFLLQLCPKYYIRRNI